MKPLLSQIRFSANTGYLWRDLPLISRIRNAGEHGFDAVEFHDDCQRAEPSELLNVIRDYALPVMSLNTAMGNTFGRAATPGLEQAAKQDIDEAIAVADMLDSRAIHVLAGLTAGTDGMVSYIENLQYALNRFSGTILIEPVCHAAVADYFLNSFSKAVSVLETVSHPRLKIMFDCFHIRHETEDLIGLFAQNANVVGHVQISSFPDRKEPVDGEIRYSVLLEQMIDAGYTGSFGCEYWPSDTVEAGLKWRKPFYETGD